LHTNPMSDPTPTELFQLALRQHQSRHLREAESLYNQLLSQCPDHVEAIHYLGVIALQEGRGDAALELIGKAITLNPSYAEAHSNLGNILMGKGQLDEAIASFRRAVELDPNLAHAHYNLGNALYDAGRFDDAIAAYHRAIALKPAMPLVFNNLGNVLKDKGRLDEAVAAYRQSISLQPAGDQAHNNLANVLKDQGQIDEAIAEYRKTIFLNPNFAQAHGNLVYAIHFHPAYDAKMIFDEHRRWNREHAEPLKKFIQPHTNDRDPGRRLRIGYVSPDFRRHSVGRFILPLLQAHDRAKFEVFCYSDVRRPDDITAKIRGDCDRWRELSRLPDDRVAQVIREDKIDILIDLAMHMASNRLPVFAQKPAPVQVTYLAYCSTTGLDTMDYRFTDPYLDPPGTSDNIYTESSLCLPETYWCYEADPRAPEVAPLSALAAGHITFGCLNNFSKVSGDTLETWSKLLAATPGSGLILHAQEGSHRQRVRNLFQSHDIDPACVEFHSRLSLPDYFALHNQIDIALDPFPCAGGTTTCDALWMGVPVITLAGRTAVSRSGVSILHNADLSDLIARTPEQYVHFAQSLAGDLPRLTEIRRTLRQKLRSSPLMNPKNFAHNVEAAYRQIWQTWCEAGKP
jgi:protein O-GlcNAc transferase